MSKRGGGEGEVDDRMSRGARRLLVDLEQWFCSQLYTMIADTFILRPLQYAVSIRIVWGVRRQNVFHYKEFHVCHLDR